MSTVNDGSKTVRNEQISLRQGDVIEVGKDLLDPHAREAGDCEQVAIVASHDCDIVSDKEAIVEIIPIKFVQKDSRNTHTKNPRILHVNAVGSDEKTVCIEIDARRKTTIQKERIRGCTFCRPLVLGCETVIEFAEWLSARYRRAALPREFDRRFNRVKDKFAKLIRIYPQEVLAILFIFDEGQEKKECGPKESYTLTILLVYSEGGKENDFEELTSKIYDLAENTYRNDQGEGQPEIEIRQCLAVSEGNITLKTYRSAVHFRLEWLSYECSPHGPVAP